MANIMLVLFVALASVISLSLGQPSTITQVGPCYGCVLYNGIGYLESEDGECDTYRQCRYDADGLAVGIELRCGFGTYWDQEKLTCNHIDQVQCTDTRCLGKVNGTRFKVSGSCSEYYECYNEVRQNQECADGYEFDKDTLDCVANASCSAAPTTTCQSIEDPNNACGYVDTFDGQLIKRNCPPGLGFNKTTCRCTILAPTGCPIVSVACEPLVDLDFKSAEVGEYDNYGAVIDTAAGTAYFNGSTAIRILRLSNVEFRKNLKIKVSYKVEYSTPTRRTGEEAVVTNGDCGEYATIEITRTGNGTNFRAATFDAASTRSTTDLSVDTADDWRDVEFFYNKAQAELFGTVNGAVEQTAFNEPLVRSQCAFQLGQGVGLEKFRGWIRYLIVTECN